MVAAPALSQADRENIAKALRARAHLLPFAQYTFPGYIETPHLKLLADELEAVERGENDRLMVFMPPRHGKSELISVRFPAWYLCRNPAKKIITITHREDLSNEAGRQVRNIVANQRIFPNVTLAPDSKAKGLWHTNAGGQYFAGGVGSGVVGFGGDLIICVTGDTIIHTASGEQRIDAIASPVLVLTWNHDWNVPEYCWAMPREPRRAANLYRIETDAGPLTATGEHPVYTVERGYVRAAELRPGDSVLRLLPHAVHSQGRAGWPGRASAREASKEALLLDVLSGTGGSENQAMPDLLATNQAIIEGGDVLICVQNGASASQTPALSRMRGEQAERSSILQPSMCESSAFEAYARGGEQPLQTGEGRVAVQSGLSPEGAPAHTRAGQGMPSVWRDTPLNGAPSGREQAERCAGEPDFALFAVPCEVTRNVELGATEALVYNLSVERNNNFFANGILTHNCDDPHGKAGELASETQREGSWGWYTTELYNRREPHGAIVIVQHRWHEADLSGRILEREPDRWRVVRLPALAERDDPLGRSIGEPLWVGRYDKDELEETRSIVGSREWNAKYQQRPAPEEGAIFRWWPTYKALPQKITQLLMPIDTAYTDTSGSDYTAWSLWWDDGDRIGIMDAQRVQMETPEAEDALRRYYHKIKAEFPNTPVKPLVRKKVAIDRVVGQHLRRKNGEQQGIPVTTVELPSAKGDDWKVVNARVVVSEFEGERMLIPHGFAPWLEDWLTEHKQFPHGQHDDYVETTLIVGRYRFRPSIDLAPRRVRRPGFLGE